MVPNTATVAWHGNQFIGAFDVTRFGNMGCPIDFGRECGKLYLAECIGDAAIPFIVGETHWEFATLWIYSVQGGKGVMDRHTQGERVFFAMCVYFGLEF
mmetsp:Transcript_18903/g.27670  ORF Transcript_18903/g.27670 Transcript_18903/m.27670 type:complete len:99 (-) Transcript_18903:1050-1346(-)